MKLTPEEKTYLEIYKGDMDNGEKALKNWKEELTPFESFYYLMQLSYENLNAFINFINNPQDAGLKSFHIYKLDIVMTMILKTIDVACRYALQNNDLDGLTLYRYEQKKLMPSYSNGELCSFKSTSFSSSEAEVFNHGDTSVLLEYNIVGFCPYIKMNDLTDSGYFGDEKEYLFPPYLACGVDGNSVDIFIDYIHEEVDQEALAVAKNNFVKQLFADQEKGVVSEELKKYCNSINSYLRSNAKTMYETYSNQISDSKSI